MHERRMSNHSTPAGVQLPALPGARRIVGFVKIDRAGSTTDWSDLASEEVLRRRSAFSAGVEQAARDHGAAQPLHWQGDGTMLFVLEAEEPTAVVRARVRTSTISPMRLPLRSPPRRTLTRSQSMARLKVRTMAARQPIDVLRVLFDCCSKMQADLILRE